MHEKHTHARETGSYETNKLLPKRIASITYSYYILYLKFFPLRERTTKPKLVSHRFQRKTTLAQRIKTRVKGKQRLQRKKRPAPGTKTRTAVGLQRENPPQRKMAQAPRQRTKLEKMLRNQRRREMTKRTAPREQRLRSQKRNRRLRRASPRGTSATNSVMPSTVRSQHSTARKYTNHETHEYTKYTNTRNTRIT